MDLFSPVTDLRGVGPARAAALQRLGYRWEDIRRALKEYEIPEG